MRLVVTGAAGFIGSNYVRHVLANSDDELTIFDALTYAGSRDTVRDVLVLRRHVAYIVQYFFAMLWFGRIWK